MSEAVAAVDTSPTICDAQAFGSWKLQDRAWRKGAAGSRPGPPGRARVSITETLGMRCRSSRISRVTPRMA